MTHPTATGNAILAELTHTHPAWCADVAAAYGFTRWADLLDAAAPNWAETGTGGGCTCLSSSVPGGAPFLALTDGEVRAPAPDGPFSLGIYASEEEFYGGEPSHEVTVTRS